MPDDALTVAQNQDWRFQGFRGSSTQPYGATFALDPRAPGYAQAYSTFEEQQRLRQQADEAFFGSPRPSPTPTPSATPAPAGAVKPTQMTLDHLYDHFGVPNWRTSRLTAQSEWRGQFQPQGRGASLAASRSSLYAAHDLTPGGTTATSSPLNSTAAANIRQQWGWT